MKPTEPPSSQFGYVRVVCNSTIQTLLCVALTCKITRNVFTQDFTWERLAIGSFAIAFCLLCAGSYFAALKGHQPSIDFTRAFWRTERASRRIFGIYVVMLGLSLVGFFNPSAGGLLLVALPFLLFIYWRKSRKVRTQ